MISYISILKAYQNGMVWLQAPANQNASTQNTEDTVDQAVRAPIVPVPVVHSVENDTLPNQQNVQHQASAGL